VRTSRGNGASNCNEDQNLEIVVELSLSLLSCIQTLASIAIDETDDRNITRLFRRTGSAVGLRLLLLLLLLSSDHARSHLQRVAYQRVTEDYNCLNASYAFLCTDHRRGIGKTISYTLSCCRHPPCGRHRLPPCPTPAAYEEDARTYKRRSRIRIKTQ
jgi:hypothetical protein